MSKITSSSADYQTFPTLFELEPNKFRLYLHCAAYVILHTPSLLAEGSDASFKHIKRLLPENPCGSRKIRGNRAATAKTKCGGYE